MADMEANKNFSPMITKLFLRGRKLEISLVFIYINVNRYEYRYKYILFQSI